jgi:glucokinase
LIAGVDLGGTRLRVLVDGRIVAETPTGPAIRPDEIAARVRAALPAGTRAVGFAVPGLVADGAVVRADDLPAIAGWRPFPELGLPGTVINDARAALLADAADLPAGATAAVVMAGTGIGAALLVHGRVLEGAGGFAGELGSVPADASGATLDMRAAGAAILRAAGCDASAFAARLSAGDAGARRIVADAGAALGRGLAGLVNLFNPARLTLAGGALRWPGYAAAAFDATRKAALAEPMAQCVLRVATDPDTLVARGAALAAARA